jgi:hypothetical protein
LSLPIGDVIPRAKRLADEWREDRRMNLSFGFSLQEVAAK